MAPRFPADTHPVAVATFPDTARDELAIDGDPVSPRDWLLAGGEPSVVGDLVDAAYTIP